MRNVVKHKQRSIRNVRVRNETSAGKIPRLFIIILEKLNLLINELQLVQQ